AVVVAVPSSKGMSWPVAMALRWSFWMARAAESRRRPRESGLTLLMLTPELAGRADLREGCPYGKAEKVHAGEPSGGGGGGAGYGSAARGRGGGDRRVGATAGPLGPAGTRAARSASEPGDAVDRPGAGGAQTAAAAGP